LVKRVRAGAINRGFAAKIAVAPTAQKAGTGDFRDDEF
jgi:hypothetical protein